MNCFGGCQGWINKSETRQITAQEAATKDNSGTTTMQQPKRKISIRQSVNYKHNNPQTPQVSYIRHRISSARDDLGEDDFKDLKFIIGKISNPNGLGQ